MKNKFMVNAVALVLLFVTSFIMAQPAAIAAAEPVKEKTFVVSIRGKMLTGHTNPADTESKVTLEPETIKVPQGATVVWVNWARRPEISISFNEGKNCEMATGARTGFSMAPETGCFITDYLTQGKTSSLRFMEVGTYKYELHVAGRIAPVASGRVEVVKP